MKDRQRVFERRVAEGGYIMRRGKAAAGNGFGEGAAAALPELGAENLSSSALVSRFGLAVRR